MIVATETSSDVGQKRILLVDDSADQRGFVRVLLDQGDRKFVEASTTSEALELIEHGEFDLAIIDLTMPEISGFELVRQFRQRFSIGELPIVVYSASADTDSIVKALHAGANDFVTKGTDAEILNARVRQALELRNSTVALRQANTLLAERQASINTDFRAAASLQRSRLPAEDTTFSNLDVGWSFDPCDILGGDLLGACQVDETKSAFFVLDATGHGIASALQAVSAHQLLQVTFDDSCIITEESPKNWWNLLNSDRPPVRAADPAAVLSRLTRRFAMNETAMFFTLVYLLIDHESGEYSVSLAGHPAPILFDAKGETRQLEFDGIPPIGIAPSTPAGTAPIPTFEGQLKPGEGLLLFSDGITEAFGLEGEMLTPAGLEKLVSKHSGFPSSELTAAILGAVDSYSGASSADDRTLLAVKFLGSPEHGW
ncbi:PP2C family protein-serine/threonine phosphatase [Stratiformator vulcanicus]|uniref:Sensor histidine kinase TodS n=1 Tax=Stratiformator vulcanicus TaxID=2527980 RepID=A0A517QX04_9PLAN|nr:fused response regulator/phosphatase [Stratiformator vulcanicus]QDT36196.1 Sensor histidine kinase TodS [Stratiformator vulcanicus]